MKMVVTAPPVGCKNTGGQTSTVDLRLVKGSPEWKRRQVIILESIALDAANGDIDKIKVARTAKKAMAAHVAAVQKMRENAPKAITVLGKELARARTELSSDWFGRFIVTGNVMSISYFDNPDNTLAIKFDEYNAYNRHYRTVQLRDDKGKGLKCKISLRDGKRARVEATTAWFDGNLEFEPYNYRMASGKRCVGFRPVLPEDEKKAEAVKARCREEIDAIGAFLREEVPKMLKAIVSAHREVFPQEAHA